MPVYFNLIVQIILIVILAVIAFLLVRLSNSLKKEKRITRFSIEAISDRPMSFFDKIEKIYARIINNLSKTLKKIKIFVLYSKKYDIFVDQTEKIRANSMDYISNKLLIGLLCTIITIISNVLRVKNLSFFQLLLSLLLGFFIPDIFLVISNKRKTKQIENDLLKAVIIMNNAFKCGRSIMQSVELVSIELDGPISDEFRKMFIDLTYGLELDTVFDRFARRVQLQEVKYMASSLVILNKTGGNIVKVFGSLERSFFDRKKLNEELKSATAVSDLVFKVLVIIPIFIFMVVYIFNSNYFIPLVTTIIGRIVLVLILTIYIVYILIVKRITKLKE